MSRFRIRLLVFAAIAAASVLCILVGTSSGGPDKPEELRKEAKAVIESQLMRYSTPVYRYYMAGLAVRDLLCVPMGMKVPDEFHLKREDLRKEPHKTRYGVVVVPNGEYQTYCYGLRVVSGSILVNY